MNLTGSGTPERIWGERVSANFFSLLGVEPSRGRSFLPEEDQPDAGGVVIITDEFGAPDLAEIPTFWAVSCTWTHAVFR